MTSKTQSLNNPMQLYIINGDIEYYSEITDGSKPKKSIFVYDIPEKTEKANDLTSKTSEQSTFINFNYGVASSTKSGCTVTRYMESGKTYETDAGVYGPNPAPQNNGYLVRGYGVPHQNPYYGALVLMSSNRGKKVNVARGVFHQNEKRGSAISIEYPFKRNTTYEITIKAKFHDNRHSLDKIYSSGYPTLYAQLKDNGIIIPPGRTGGETQDSCEREDLNDIKDFINDYVNYIRAYTLDSNIEVTKEVSFQFSPINEKKALLLSLHPTMATEGYGLPIPTNSHTMILYSITLTEKTFDPSLNVSVPDNSGGGRR
ncbi:hypothetical protein B0A64_12170 [Flavobacterium araucananum]|uniref:Uncharacterized protein n=2 Tax=Flavobacterium araucananum TaxID=946678 RepID=A0A227P9B0_9FLAO|nr:hypothetical protein B0A64_12170 [Flavobacterium araucananum]